jgi:hypothetical protein
VEAIKEKKKQLLCKTEEYNENEYKIEQFCLKYGKKGTEKGGSGLLVQQKECPWKLQENISGDE